MREVTRDEFFGRIYKQNLDVHPRIINDRYPYICDWHFPRRPHAPAYGRTVDRVENGQLLRAYFVEDLANA